MSPFWLRLDPEHALEEPRMAIRVPGEFHEASSRGQLCHRASRSPSYARPRHFPTRDEFISTAGHEPRDPTSLPAAPRPTTTSKDPATLARPPPTTSPATQPNRYRSSPDHRPTTANRRPQPSTTAQPPARASTTPSRVIRLCGRRLAGPGRC